MLFKNTKCTRKFTAIKISLFRIEKIPQTNKIKIKKCKTHKVTVLFPIIICSCNQTFGKTHLQRNFKRSEPQQKKKNLVIIKRKTTRTEAQSKQRTYKRESQKYHIYARTKATLNVTTAKTEPLNANSRLP